MMVLQFQNIVLHVYSCLCIGCLEYLMLLGYLLLALYSYYLVVLFYMNVCMLYVHVLYDLYIVIAYVLILYGKKVKQHKSLY